jgi:GTP-binding protein
MAHPAPGRREETGQGKGIDAVFPADFTPEPATLETGRLLFAKPCEFRTGAASADSLPADGLPEVAFAGRSNVGKSSLLNALTGHSHLARVSHTPGRTQQLNFFELDGRIMLVDLPGYGYARARKRAVANWNKLIEHYLKGRQRLRRVLLLIDARHGFKPADTPVMKLLDEAALSYLIVLTKCDQVKAEALRKLARSMAGELARHPAAYPALHLTSAHDGSGIAELRAAIASLTED